MRQALLLKVVPHIDSSVDRIWYGLKTQQWKHIECTAKSMNAAFVGQLQLPRMLTKDGRGQVSLTRGEGKTPSFEGKNQQRC